MSVDTTWDNVDDIVNDAAVELGLTTSRVSVLASEDAAYVQLLALLVAACRELVRIREWPQLRMTTGFTTAPGNPQYQIPSDVLRIIDNTAWSTQARLPLVGPLSPADWQALLIRPITSAIGPYFRVDGDVMTLLPTPASAYVVTYEYRSRFWTYNSGSDAYYDYPQDGPDPVLLDAVLVKSALKLKWQQAKGQDTTAAQQDYDRALDNASSIAAPASALVFGRTERYPLLSGWNVPDTGIGRP
jgi:hypothetical protein